MKRVEVTDCALIGCAIDSSIECSMSEGRWRLEAANRLEAGMRNYPAPRLLNRRVALSDNEGLIDTQ